jgi:adenylate kinase
LNQATKVLIFIGPPGAGKGSIASLCVKQFDWLQISTGNLCRKHIAEQTKIGKEIDLIIKSGKLINDDLINLMVFEWLHENTGKASGVIFDGYPRTVAQAEAFNALINTQFPDVQVKVVLFDISDDVVVNRLCSRYICQNKECQAVYSLSPESDLTLVTAAVCDLCSGHLGRRDDDTEVAVRKRLDIYHRHEDQLINFYHDNGTKIIKLDASKPLSEVFETFMTAVGE